MVRYVFERMFEWRFSPLAYRLGGVERGGFSALNGVKTREGDFRK